MPTEPNEQYSAAFDAIAVLCIATGNAPIKGKVWEFVVDDQWQFAVNGTGTTATPKAAEGRMDAPALRRYECVIWYNGFLAGIIDPRSGVIVAGEGANEDAFIDAIQRRIAVVRSALERVVACGGVLTPFDCFRCKGVNVGRYAWGACAVGLETFFLCESCDLFINGEFLKLLRVEDRARMMRNYRAKLKRRRR